MLRKVVSIMPRLFFVFSVVWLLIAQAVFVVSLWDIDSDQPELFHSRVLHWILWRVLNVVELGSVPTVAVGLLLLAIVLVFRNRRNGWHSITDVIWVASGIACMAMLFVSGFLVWWGEPEYYTPPPGLPQFIRVGIVVALDIVLGIAIWHLVLKYRASNRPRYSDAPTIGKEHI